MAEMPAMAPACATPDRNPAPLVIAAETLLRVAPAPREMLLGAVLPRASLTLLYGSRGVGKTFLALSMALAVASGGTALRWRAERPARVLHVDGEMPRATLIERLSALASGAGLLPEDDNLRLLAAEGDAKNRIDLGTEDGRARIEAHCGDVDLLVLDSLSVLLRSQNADSGRTWLGVEDWLLRLRRRGLAVLIVRNGKMMSRDGSDASRHADVVDTAIAIRRPEDYEAFEGARFDLRFTKGRALLGKAAQPFEAALHRKDGQLRWFVSSREDALAIRAAGLFFEGYTVREVAHRLRISKSRAHELGREAIARMERNAAMADSDRTDSGQADLVEKIIKSYS
jgi:putative DNA primase/helicase